MNHCHREDQANVFLIKVYNNCTYVLPIVIIFRRCIGIVELANNTKQLNEDAYLRLLRRVHLQIATISKASL